MQQKIKLKQERDFGSVIGDSLKFIKQNFKSFFGNMLIVVGPFLLISALSYAFANTYLQAFKANPMGGINYSALLIPGSVFLIFSFLSSSLMYSYVYNYINLYEKNAEGEAITLSQITTSIKATLLKIMGAMVSITLVTLAVMGILTLILYLLMTALGVAGGIIIGFAIFFGAIIYLPILVYFLSSGFYLVVRDGMSMLPALGQVKNYMKNNFWWTWLLMVIVVISLMIINGLFSLPVTVITLIDTFKRHDMSNQSEGNSALLLALYTLSMFLTTIISSINSVVSVFQYTSLEEKQEGKGLLERIDDIK